MRVKCALLGGVALGVLMAAPRPADAKPERRHRPPPAAAPPSATDQAIAGLRQTVAALESRLSAAEADAKAAQADSARARADAGTAQARLAEQIETLPAEVSSAVAAKAPKTDKIYYKGVTLTLGGFVEAAGIYRSRNEVSDISSSFSRIPFLNSPLAHTDEFRGSARQTRLSLLAQGDISPETHAAFYGEFDFQAGAQTSNSVESNSYVPRIRHLYGTLDWDRYGLHLLAGQSWSLVTMNNLGITPRNEVPPPLIDGQYLPGFVWARQPQIRVVKDWGRVVWAAISLENPQSSFSSPATGVSATAAGVSVLTTSPGISGFDSANSLSINHVPDVVGKLAYEPQIGGRQPLHLEVFGIWRNYTDRIGVAAGNALGLPATNGNSNVSGGGVGGGITANAVPGRLDVEASAMTGRGIGRYGSAQLPDATLQPDGKIAPIDETMFLAGGTFHATPKMDLYVFGGEEREGARFFDVGANHFGFGNPGTSFTAATCTTEGGVCAPNIQQIDQITGGFWDKLYTGGFGQIRVGVQYSHTNVTAFAGAAGFTPKTSDDMVFTSFRYYPP
jgi:hypothetical protein